MASDTHVYLLGRPPIDEYLGFVIQASSGGTYDLSAEATKWRAARDRIDQLSLVEAGAADGHVPGGPKGQLKAKADAFMAQPVTKNAYAILPASVGIVELDRLVVFQKQINLSYANQLQAAATNIDIESETLFDYCINATGARPSIARGQANANTFTFVSPSTDARFLGSALLDATAVTGYSIPGHVESVVVLFVGYGINALAVVDAGGRLILNNGSHRAYALRKAGATHAWAVVQQASKEEDLSIMPVVQQNVELYLRSTRPPMLRDYFNPDLVASIEVPRRNRQVKLQFGLEQLDVPS